MNNKKCIDMGSAYCPCVLGLSGKCIVCEKMNGGSCADCNWQGVCIKTLAEQNALAAGAVRRERRLKILTRKDYTENLKVFVLEAPEGFCQKAAKAGSYIFARRAGAASIYDLPVSILKSDPEEGIIHIAINGCGPKSLDIFKAEDALCVRGVYFNGLSGLTSYAHGEGEMRTDKEIHVEKKSRTRILPGTLVYAKGVAIAPLNNLAGRLEPIARVYVDMAKMSEDFFYEYFGWIDASKCVITDFRTNQKVFEEACNMSADSTIAALVSPYYVNLIKENFKGRLITPVAGNFCCGEGICGACSFDDPSGETVHRCKETNT